MSQSYPGSVPRRHALQKFRRSLAARAQAVMAAAFVVIPTSFGMLQPLAAQAASRAALSISGTPATSVQTGKAYSFQPSVAGGSGKTLRFSIANHPGWSSFNTATGRLTGSYNSSGTFSGIVIRVTDGTTTAALPAFSIRVNWASSGGGGGTSPAAGDHSTCHHAARNYAAGDHAACHHATGNYAASHHAAGDHCAEWRAQDLLYRHRRRSQYRW